jgi:hypothetical protein
MPDNLTRSGPVDRTRIDLNDSWDVTWWRGQLGCTEEQLQRAVQAVGVSVEKVRSYLRK